MLVRVLQAQVQICTEDFESERRDRERAQSKVTRLEAEISKYKKEVDYTMSIGIEKCSFDSLSVEHL